MLMSARTLLQNARLGVVDGELGEVVDFLFDDSIWVIRFLVARTVPGIGRRVLIPSEALGRPNPDGRRIEAALTRRQVFADPGVTDQQQQGSGPLATSCSLRELLGRPITARGRPVGDLHDLILEVDGWQVHRLVVDLSESPSDLKVLVPPIRILRVTWSEPTLDLDMPWDELEQLPPHRFSRRPPLHDAASDQPINTSL